jgi:hypothetical protein
LALFRAEEELFGLPAEEQPEAETSVKLYSLGHRLAQSQTVTQDDLQEVTELDSHISADSRYCPL